MNTTLALRRPRLLIRALVGAFLVLAGVLAPVESPPVPEPLEDVFGILGTEPAHAQTAVIDGTARPCPSGMAPDTSDSSLCVRSESPCRAIPSAVSSLNSALSGVSLSRSTDFPNFCEYTIVKATHGDAAYNACVALTGYVIKSTSTDCRMIQSALCPAGLHRVSPILCRRVQRRTWSCTMPGTIKANEFNKCYRVQGGVDLNNHPACGTGAPTFAILGCAEYVGQDFVRMPPAGECPRFATGNTRSAMTDHTTNLHWCQFDARFLNVDCYPTSATCTASTAYCVKRASQTGGCYTIAETLRCRDTLAKHIADSAAFTADDVYAAGCVPCQILPFQPVSTDCPEAMRDEPDEPNALIALRLKAAHAVKEDFYYAHPDCESARNPPHTASAACLAQTTCADPPRGRLEWESGHQSRLAVVNSPVTLRVTQVPTQTHRVPFFNGRYPRPMWVWNRTLLRHHGSTETVRTWLRTSSSTTLSDLSALVSNGQCLILRLPDFRATVTELWPDNDSTAITDLFGADALEWWQSLSGSQQQAHTEARGLVYVGGSVTPAVRAAELARRRSALTEEIECNYDTDIWCRWQPRRPGYYQLTASAGWWMTRMVGPIRADGTWRSNIHNFIVNNTSPPDGMPCNDTLDRANDRPRDQDCLLADIASMGMASPAEAGLLTDGSTPPKLVGVLPPEPLEWAYSTAGARAQCPSQDVRFFCSGAGTSLNYTTTEPVGVLVHEVRVSSVPASG